jgi:hypothetical protein
MLSVKFFTAILSVVMLGVIMLGVIMLSVIMLSVLALIRESCRSSLLIV